MDAFLIKAQQVISSVKSEIITNQTPQTWQVRKAQEQKKWIERYQKVTQTVIPYSQLRSANTLYPDYYSHCLDVLEKSHFDVLQVKEQERNDDKNEWEHSHYLIKFICIQNGWMCCCGLKESCDIEEGMFQLRHLYHLETGRYVDFYCDMFGHNTGLPRFSRALQMMQKGWDQYYNETYSYYLKLPQLLGHKGFETQLEKIQYDLENPYLRFKVQIPIDQQAQTQMNYCSTKTSCFDSVYSQMERCRIDQAIQNHTYYLIVLEAYHSGVEWDTNSVEKTEDWFGLEKFFITNNAQLDCNSAREIGFSSDVSCCHALNWGLCVDDLITALLSFDREMHSCYGYVENGHYYNHNNLNQIMDQQNLTLHQKYYDHFNHHRMNFNYKSHHIDLLHGLNEIYYLITLSLNDSMSQFKNEYQIQIIYPKQGQIQTHVKNLICRADPSKARSIPLEESCVIEIQDQWKSEGTWSQTIQSVSHLIDQLSQQMASS